MSDLYLRPNVQVEPLFDHWYAWPHLIPPATAARNITERHLKIIESFINAPEVHASAVRNPKFLGGPFIDHNPTRVNEIKALRDSTLRDRSHLIELSTALAELDAMLRSNARGYSLQPLYSKVPSILRGFVELTYDLNNNPSFRIIEPLLYRSEYYDKSAQSLMLSLIYNDNRPFILSTPRLRSSDSITLRLPFDDKIVDSLFRMKRTPCRSNIRDNFDIEDTEEQLLTSMFSEQLSAPYVRYSGPGVRWRYFGHACILIETASTSILIDPVLSYTYDGGVSRYTYEDLPDHIDFVLITHNHQDHILFETLLQIRHKVDTFIVPANGGGTLQDPSVKLLLQHFGCRNIVELREMETVEFGHGSILGLPFLGEHADLDVLSKMAYLVRIGPHKLLFAADSCNIEPVLYDKLHRETGDISALFLGMECDGAPLSWLYGPLLTQKFPRELDQSRRLAGSNYEQAAKIVASFNCQQVYVYAMGQEPWLNYIMSLKYTEESRPIVASNQLIRECQARGLHAERLFAEKEILL
jgi:L-ascorbate metabolism protein UlaG (beta-lactamase superfamily)